MPIDATPTHIKYGVKDESGRKVPVVKRGSPQFLPVFFLFTEKGDYIKRVVNFAEFNEYYGADSLNPTSKFFNHTSDGARTILQAGGLISVKRLKPVSTALPVTEAKTANVTINAYITDAVSVPKYKREANGKISRDALGEPINATPVVNINRRSIYFTAEQDGDVTVSPTAETYADGTITLVTKKYPIFQLKASGNGLAYNDYGFNFDVNLGNDNERSVSDKGLLQFALGLVKRKNGRIINLDTNFGTSSVNGVLKLIQGHPETGNNISLKYKFDKDYGNTSDIELPLSPRVTEDIEFNFDNIALLQGVIKIHIDTEEGVNKYDFDDTSEKGIGLANFVNCKSTTGIEYESVSLLPTDPKITAEYKAKPKYKLIDLASSTNVFLQGGEDLPLTTPASTFNTMLEPAIEIELDKYADKNSPVQNLAKNKESIFIDTGFTTPFKIKNLFKFFLYRKDTMPIASTYHNDGTNKALTVTQELSTASAITATLRMVQESKRYGTRGFRAVIIGGSGLPADGVNPYRVPLTMDFIYKATLQMGASNGYWNPLYAFDIQPNNIINRLKSIQPADITDGAKQSLTRAGVIYPEPNDVNEYFYPARQTIYEDSTSVLNSFPVAVAVTYIEKMLETVWRMNTGADTYTDPELKLKVEADLSDLLDGKYGTQYIVVPTVYFTPFDKASGSSWSCKIDFYAPNMKTVMHSHIVALRKEA